MNFRELAVRVGPRQLLRQKGFRFYVAAGRSAPVGAESALGGADRKTAVIEHNDVAALQAMVLPFSPHNAAVQAIRVALR